MKLPNQSRPVMRGTSDATIREGGCGPVKLAMLVVPSGLQRAA